MVAKKRAERRGKSSWPIGAINTPGFGRKGLTHNVLSFMDGPPAMKLHGFDDEVCTALCLNEL